MSLIHLNLANFESYLDAGQIEVEMSNGCWWRLRRNGKTQRWVRDPHRLRVPIKAGLKAYGAITEDDFDALGRLNGHYRLAV